MIRQMGTYSVNPNFRILIKTKNGTSVAKIYLDKTGKSWIEARDGSEFIIEIKNNNYYNKMLVVSSVDGLNVINGERAKLENKNGYVINNNSKETITGWRISPEEVKSFVFSKNKKDSYAYRLSGDESNVGAIGIACYEEIKTNNWNFSVGPYQPITFKDPTYYTTRDVVYTTGSITPQASYTTTCCAAEDGLVNFSSTIDTATEPSFSMGTAMGETQKSASIYTNEFFDATPFFVSTIYYDSRENLIKNGIIIPDNKLPEPFENSGFCKVI